MTSVHEPPSALTFLSPAEARKRLGISRRTLQRYVANGIITPAGRLPNGHARFSSADVDSLIRSGHEGDKPEERSA